MNKEKEIEEMAEVIDKRIDFASEVIGSMNRGKGHWIAEGMFPTYRKAEEVRKETAKEIYDLLIDETVWETDTIMIGVDWLKDKIKKYGVEVDE